MADYEMLQALLNEEDFRKSLNDHQPYDDARLTLRQIDNNEYLLQVNLIHRLAKENITVLSCEFEFGVTNRNSLTFFMIRFNELVHLKATRTTVEIAEMIEDFLKSNLN